MSWLPIRQRKQADKNNLRPKLPDKAVAAAGVGVAAAATTTRQQRKVVASWQQRQTENKERTNSTKAGKQKGGSRERTWRGIWEES